MLADYFDHGAALGNADGCVTFRKIKAMGSVNDDVRVLAEGLRRIIRCDFRTTIAVLHGSWPSIRFAGSGHGWPGTWAFNQPVVVNRELLAFRATVNDPFRGQSENRTSAMVALAVASLP